MMHVVDSIKQGLVTTPPAMSCWRVKVDQINNSVCCCRHYSCLEKKAKNMVWQRQTQFSFYLVSCIVHCVLAFYQLHFLLLCKRGCLAQAVCGLAVWDIMCQCDHTHVTLQSPAYHTHIPVWHAVITPYRCYQYEREFHRLLLSSIIKHMGSNPAEASHYVTTVGKLFTPTVPSGAEGQHKQLTPGIAGTSIVTVVSCLPV